jgi:hypothetical protein
MEAMPEPLCDTGRVGWLRMTALQGRPICEPRRCGRMLRSDRRGYRRRSCRRVDRPAVSLRPPESLGPGRGPSCTGLCPAAGARCPGCTATGSDGPCGGPQAGLAQQPGHIPPFYGTACQGRREHDWVRSLLRQGPGALPGAPSPAIGAGGVRSFGGEYEFMKEMSAAIPAGPIT